MSPAASFRSLGRVGVAVGLATAVVVPATRASASCAAPTEVAPVTVAFHGRLVGEVGTAADGALFEFAVDTVDKGLVESTATVDIAVDREVAGPSGQQLHQSNSVSIGSAPVRGKRYHVEALEGTDEAGIKRLFVNACVGRLDLAVPLPHDHTRPSTTGRVVGLSVAAGGVVLILGAFGVLRRRRRPAQPGDPA